MSTSSPDSGSMSSNSSLQNLGPITDFPEGSLTEKRLGKQHLLVVSQGGEFYIMDARCPHMGGNLSHGKLQDGKIVCPVHGSEFDIATGEVARWTTFDGAILGIVEFVRHPRPVQTYEAVVSEDGTLWMGAKK